MLHLSYIIDDLEALAEVEPLSTHVINLKNAYNKVKLSVLQQTLGMKGFS
jgi:hypothetical protein